MDVLKIFYENIIKEAQTGRIDAWFYYNIIFSTRILESNEFYEAKKNDELFIPTLIIRNKELFDNLLVEYVEKALEFYDDDNFDSEILNYKQYDEVNKICKEKVILTYIFANMTAEDFANVELYLKRKIDYLDNDYTGIYDLGYSNNLKSNLKIYIEKDIINNETPYKLTLKALNNDDIYIFPSVKFGISNNKLYIYAIQSNKNNETSSFYKKINRLLFKIGTGFDPKIDNIDIYGEGNLKDVTSSFLVSSNVALAFFDNLGITDIIIPSILIERYNAKVSSISYRLDRNNIDKNKANELYSDQIRIQNNITQKFIRTFLRLCHHYRNINVVSLPGDYDNNLYLKQTNDIDCNNDLLYDTNILTQNSIKK